MTEGNRLRKVIVCIFSEIVTVSVIAYLNTLPKPVFEEPYWTSIIALLFLYWIIFINWYSKSRRKEAGSLKLGWCRRITVLGLRFWNLREIVDVPAKSGKSVLPGKIGWSLWWCGGWDLNPRTPTGQGPKPCAFDQAWLPPLSGLSPVLAIFYFS